MCIQIVTGRDRQIVLEPLFAVPGLQDRKPFGKRPHQVFTFSGLGYECMCAQLDGEAVLSAEFVQRDDLADERMEIELSDSLLEEREGPA